MPQSQLLQNYARVEESVEDACNAVGRKRSEVCLVAVSKLHPASAVATIASAGQADFGENYVQEALEKKEILTQTSTALKLRWHMIGHVQSRKAAQVAGQFCMIHTLDSEKLAAHLEKRLTELELAQDVLIEVSIANEPQKSGVLVDKLPVLADYVIENCPHLNLLGLMCLPPVFDSGDAARPWFNKLRNLRDQLVSQTGLPLPELSMGMSGDFAAAIAEGASIVRIGTSIFGQRPKKK